MLNSDLRLDTYRTRLWELPTRDATVVKRVSAKGSTLKADLGRILPAAWGVSQFVAVIKACAVGPRSFMDAPYHPIVD